MKVGIITFHWAANYGAVLQTYALQKAVEKMDVSAEIIDYRPKQYERKWWKCFVSRSLHSMRYKLSDYIKNKKIQRDICGKLHLSKQYESAEKLKENPPLYDVYISGSDQIWNEFFTLSGEENVTLSYFLDFAPKGARKISYATSIGSAKLCEEYWRNALPLLKEYESISVREQSAKKVLEEKGLRVVISPDPTLLIEAGEYEQLFTKMPAKIAYYILQNNQHTIACLKKYLEKNYAKGNSVDLNRVTLAEWGGYIANAEYVLTNSYHGIIFSLLNHRKFFAVLIEGELQGMNDRVITLLERLDLKNRIVGSVKELEKARTEAIDWNTVDMLLAKYREEGSRYLKKNLK